MKKLDQRGSGIVELALVVLVVGVVGFIGWSVWQRHHRVAQTTAQASVIKNVAPYRDQETKQYYDCLKSGGARLLAAPVCHDPNYGTDFMPLPDNATSLHYITIKEWGIRSPYYGSQDITYTLNGNYAEFSSKQLDALLTFHHRAVSIQKYGPNDKVYGEGDIDVGLGVAKDVFATKAYRAYVSHVGENYYSYIGPQSGLTPLQSEHDYQVEATAHLVVDTIRSFIPKWEAVPAP